MASNQLNPMTNKMAYPACSCGRSARRLARTRGSWAPRQQHGGRGRSPSQSDEREMMLQQKATLDNGYHNKLIYTRVVVPYLVWHMGSNLPISAIIHMICYQFYHSMECDACARSNWFVVWLACGWPYLQGEEEGLPFFAPKVRENGRCRDGERQRYHDTDLRKYQKRVRVCVLWVSQSVSEWVSVWMCVVCTLWLQWR